MTRSSPSRKKIQPKEARIVPLMLPSPPKTTKECPNCGAPIDGDDRIRCSYCDVQLCDPALDWVVDRIDLQ